MNKSLLRSVLLISLTMLTNMAFAKNGKSLVMQGNSNGAIPCSACHGVNGAGQAASGFPKLAGINPAYLKKQLRDFQSGSRSNPIMQPIAKALSMQEISDVAEYFSSLSVATETKNIDAEKLRLGKKIAEKGKWEVGMPSCFRCHGEGAQGIAENFPALAGQHASYIKNQLLAWKKDNRKNDPVGLMKSVADKLTEKEIDAVAAYLSTLAAK